MIDMPMTVEKSQKLGNVLEASSGWVSQFIPENTFLVVALREQLHEISSVPGNTLFWYGCI